MPFYSFPAESSRCPAPFLPRPPAHAARSGRCAGARAPSGPTTFPSPGRTSATSAVRTAACRSSGPIGWTIAAALRFLEDAHAEGVGILGFTGGEPFLYPEFVHTVCRRAAELGFRFDKIMTNGVWHADAAHLEAVLTELAAGGFTRQAGPERGQVPRRPHGQGGGVLPRRPRACSAATTSCRCPTPAAGPTRGWSRCTRWRGSWTRWSTGRTCCIAICWCRRS